MSDTDYITTACQACDHVLNVHTEAFGMAFPCPECSTSLELALKCACSHCGGPLSFPVEAMGVKIQCGHCQETTMLLPSTIISSSAADTSTAMQAESPPTAKIKPFVKKAEPSAKHLDADGKATRKGMPPAVKKTPAANKPSFGKPIPPPTRKPMPSKSESVAKHEKIETPPDAPLHPQPSGKPAEADFSLEPKPKPQSSSAPPWYRARQREITLAFTAVVVLGGILWLVLRGGEPTRPVFGTAISKPIDLSDKVQVSASAIKPGSSRIITYITATLRNTSDEVLPNVEVTFNLLNKANQSIGTAADQAFNLKPGKEATVRAVITQINVAAFRVKSVLGLKR